MTTAEPALPADAQIRRDPLLGTITFLRGPNLSAPLEADPGFRAVQATDRFADIAVAFLAAFGGAFRLDRPAEELRVRSTQVDELGLKHIRFLQVFAGLVVWGAELNVHLDRANHVYLAQGRYVPTPHGVATTPRLSQAEAARVAAADTGSSGSDCGGCSAELMILATTPTGPRLVYRIQAAVSISEGWEVLVDAESGRILQKLPTVFQR